MTIKDNLSGRLPETAMRDLLRQLDRDANANHPARPTAPPPPPPDRSQNTAAMALRSTQTDEHASVAVGSWRLREDALSGDLIAVDPDGHPHTLISRGGP